MGRKKTHEEFVDEVYSLVGNEYDVIGTYDGALKKIEMFHMECGSSYHVLPANFLFGQRCPLCQRYRGRKSHEEFIKEVEYKFGNEYEILGTYQKYEVPLLVKHNKCGYEWEVSPNNFLQGQSKCPKCSRRIKYDTESFRSIVNEITKGEYELIGEYINNYTKTLFKHLNCGYTWNICPSEFYNNNTRCPRCQGKERYTTEYFGKLVRELTNNEYCLKSNYVNNRTEVEIEHLHCNTVFCVVPTLFLYEERRCPTCKNTNSKGERKISEILSTRNIEFKQQFTFEDCKFIKLLRFDFGILKDGNLIALIEFDGKQHYEPIKWFGGVTKYELQQGRDSIKNEYCKTNGIPLLRIPYWEYSNIENILIKFLKDLQN